MNDAQGGVKLEKDVRDEAAAAEYVSRRPPSSNDGRDTKRISQSPIGNSRTLHAAIRSLSPPGAVPYFMLPDQQLCDPTQL